MKKNIYSYSKISCFEQCPLKFKFRYIDRIKTEEKGIEAHLGGIIHETLEWIYNNVKDNRTPGINEVIEFYKNKWEEKYSENVVIIKEEFTDKDYFNKGIKFIVEYYMRHKPFDDGTIECEKEIFLNLDREGIYRIRGIIDRLVYNPETEEYEIHDYKTTDFLPSREKLENDKQLPLYSLAIKENLGKDNEVCLVWHFLAHDKKIHLKKKEEELEELKKEIIGSIKKIESEKDFPAHLSKLCGWCEYRSICPDFKEQRPF